jgi:hypothetical protein
MTFVFADILDVKSVNLQFQMFLSASNLQNVKCFRIVFKMSETFPCPLVNVAPRILI